MAKVITVLITSVGQFIGMDLFYLLLSVCKLNTGYAWMCRVALEF